MLDNMPKLFYRTSMGQSFLGDSLALLPTIETESVDLILTSPPFALKRKKEYGNEDEDKYVDWFMFKILTNNFYPIDADIQVYLLDSLNNIIDSIIPADKRILPRKVFIMWYTPSPVKLFANHYATIPRENASKMFGLVNEARKLRWENNGVPGQQKRVKGRSQ